MRFVCFIIVFLLLMGVVSGHEYTLIAKENGEALVLITLLGNGTYTLNLPSDVSNVKVKGALYTIDGNEIELAIGETEKAVMGYTTSVLTSKTGKEWSFDIATLPDSSATLYLPSEAMISKTQPQTYIEDGDLKKMEWDSTDEIHMEYHFPTEVLEENVDDNLAPVFDPGNNEPTTNDKAEGTNPVLYVIVFLFILILIGMLATVVLLKRNPQKEKTKSSAQEAAVVSKDSETTEKLSTQEPKKDDSKKAHIFKTLPENEATIVRIVHAHEGGIKRSMLEKESKIAKSSLASSLFNLEKKNIVEVDKTYTTHYVKFTEWFKEL